MKQCPSRKFILFSQVTHCRCENSEDADWHLHACIYACEAYVPKCWLAVLLDGFWSGSVFVFSNFSPINIYYLSDIFKEKGKNKLKKIKYKEKIPMFSSPSNSHYLDFNIFQVFFLCTYFSHKKGIRVYSALLQYVLSFPCQ